MEQTESGVCRSLNSVWVPKLTERVRGRGGGGGGEEERVSV